ncbi:MAG TPA: hypothetical protein VMR33_21550 [Candidatus Baltobacteraceae bacterium]|jgi:hypothetical protein|nr:hypothetical protein [Candidatus Baltobacteraceae bacterium]
MGIDAWAGRFHMEMVRWHLAHYALWNRWPLATNALDCYQRFVPAARALAAQLDSRESCFWKVRSWDEAGEPSPWSKTACWEMGFLSTNDWRAQWIALTTNTDELPAPFFRRELMLDGKVKKARIYIRGLGYYELHARPKTRRNMSAAARAKFAAIARARWKKARAVGKKALESRAARRDWIFVIQ